MIKYGFRIGGVALWALLFGCGAPSSQARGRGPDASASTFGVGTADTGAPPGAVEETVVEASDAADAPDTAAAPDVAGLGPVCIPGAAECGDEQTVKRCDELGSAWVDETCPVDERCWEGQCAPVICTAGEAVAECGGPASTLSCNAVGTHFVPVPCEAGLSCFEGQCVSYVCAPGDLGCQGFAAVRRCRADGGGWDLIEECEKGGTCFDGACISACDVNIKAASYSGCEFFAVDLDNVEGGEFESLAVVVSVPSTVSDATVQITETATSHVFTPAELGVSTMSVLAGSLGVFRLPPGGDIDGSTLTRRAYHVVTSSPATVHQFNPLNGEDVYTNDASLLLPSTVAGEEYYIMSWPMRVDESVGTLRGFATVVAVSEGTTQVWVTPRADVAAGGVGSGVGAIAAGTSESFVLQQGDVLNLETDGEQGADLTGTRITSDKPVTSFGGHECANVPLGINACDHLEQQMLPVAAWGKRYIADPFKARSATQFDIYRVMAGETDVLVQTDPPQPGYEQFLLQPGAYVTFSSSQRFVIQADGRVLVAHYMIGSSYPGHVQSCESTGIGDPALTLAVPTAQFLSEYTVLTPPGYVENYINVIAPAGAEVLVDGAPLAAPLKAVGAAAEWGVAQVPVGAGVHSVTATQKIGLTAYGYDCDVSYAYPGGLRLLTL